MDLAHDGSQLVRAGRPRGPRSTPTTPTPAPRWARFTTAVPVNFLATAGNITVLGSTQINQIHMINLPASLQTGTAQAAGFDRAVRPAARGLPARRPHRRGRVEQPLRHRRRPLQHDPARPVPARHRVDRDALGQRQLAAAPRCSTSSRSISRTGLVTNGNYTTVQINPIPAGQIGDGPRRRGPEPGAGHRRLGRQQHPQALRPQLALVAGGRSRWPIPTC